MSKKVIQPKLFGFFSKRPRCESSNPQIEIELDVNNVEKVQEENNQGISSKPQVIDSSCSIEVDPGLRLPIHALAKNSKETEIIRRAYLLKGPCQPHLKSFPQSIIYNAPRRFNIDWYDEFPWLEYSVSEDAAYFLYFYLFKPRQGGQGGGDTFVTEGYKHWNKKEGFKKHMGGCGSVHNNCYMAAQDLLQTNAHIDVHIANKSMESKKEYYIQLCTSVKAIRYLLRQGLAFRGHDESKSSMNKGNFLHLLELMAEDNEEIKRVVLGNAPGNSMLISSQIQREIIHAFAHFVSKTIVSDIGDDFFCCVG